MKNFPFVLPDEDYRAYRPDGVFKQDLLLHKHAQVVFPRLLDASEPPFSVGLDATLSEADQQFAFSLVQLLQTYQVMEPSDCSMSTGVFETAILYEHHPYIEVLLEFLLRRLGCSFLRARRVAAEIFMLRSCVRIPPRDISSTRSHHSIFSLAESALEVLRPLQTLCTQTVGKPVLPAEEMQSARKAAQRLIEDLQHFFRSDEVRAYLDLRAKTYCQVFNRTVQYAESIVERYRECSMVMTELRFAGGRWNDDGIRHCADQVGGLMSKCFKALNKQDILGHAWRLDAVLAGTKHDPIGTTVWRVRWLTFVREEELGPACYGDELAAILLAGAQEALAGISSSPSLSSAVIKDMTALIFEQPPATGGSAGVAGYKQLIERWVYELSMGEIYHRIRVLKGGRPMMCGRGHPSDGRSKKQSTSSNTVSRRRFDSAS